MINLRCFFNLLKACINNIRVGLNWELTIIPFLYFRNSRNYISVLLELNDSLLFFKQLFLVFIDLLSKLRFSLNFNLCLYRVSENFHLKFSLIVMQIDILHLSLLFLFILIPINTIISMIPFALILINKLTQSLYSLLQFAYYHLIIFNRSLFIFVFNFNAFFPSL